MAEWMPWIIILALVAGLVAAVVMVSRLASSLAAKLAELSTRKPFYVLNVEGGKPGVNKVIRMEPTVEPDEGMVSLPTQGAPPDMDDDDYDPNRVDLDSRG